jgi:hypothetical protein
LGIQIIVRIDTIIINRNNSIYSKLANGLSVGQIVEGYFKYDTGAFYLTLSNANLGIQMLGSFPIIATIISKSGNTAVVQFSITNNLG